MANQRFTASEIQGLNPAVDPVQSEQIFVISGRNYILDSLGPRSVFGNRFLLPQPRFKPIQIQGLRVKIRTGDHSFTMDGDGIWEWNEWLGWQCIYRTQDTTIAPNRWTYGYLSDLIFFCHPTTGILVYDQDSKICQPISNLTNVFPNDAVAITVNNGRICAVTRDTFAWSAPSNGLDWVPQLGGPGFQFISDRISGRPITISSFPGGCLAWTTGGVLRAEFTGDSFVFRFRALNTEYRPVNSFCLVRINDETSIILDERGLFQCKGSDITPFAPIFNEFLIDYIQRNQIKFGDNLRLEWDELTRRIYVSISLSTYSPLYEQCFVLYTPLDKWGSFDEPHYGILPVQITHSIRNNDYFGFVDAEGCVRYWNRARSRELPTEEANLNDANLFYPTSQIPTQFSDIGITVSSNATLETYSKAPFNHRRAGYYYADGVMPIPRQVEGLDSSVTIGSFRPLGPNSSDQLSEVINVLVRNQNSDPEGGYPPDSDFNDWPLGKIGDINHQLEIHSSLDGVTSFESVTPMMVGFQNAGRYYSCSSVGVWHNLEIRADAVGDSFHIHTLAFDATNAGRWL